MLVGLESSLEHVSLALVEERLLLIYESVEVHALLVVGQVSLLLDTFSFGFLLQLLLQPQFLLLLLLLPSHLFAHILSIEEGRA